MRRRRGPFAAWCSIILGVFILLILILPAWFWWLIGIGAVICGGIWISRC